MRGPKGLPPPTGSAPPLHSTRPEAHPRRHPRRAAVSSPVRLRLRQGRQSLPLANDALPAVGPLTASSRCGNTDETIAWERERGLGQKFETFGGRLGIAVPQTARVIRRKDPASRDAAFGGTGGSMPTPQARRTARGKVQLGQRPAQAGLNGTRVTSTGHGWVRPLCAGAGRRPPGRRAGPAVKMSGPEGCRRRVKTGP